MHLNRQNLNMHLKSSESQHAPESPINSNRRSRMRVKSNKTSDINEYSDDIYQSADSDNEYTDSDLDSDGDGDDN